MSWSNNKLLGRLCALDVAAERGFSFERLACGDILINRRGHAYGVWQTRVNGYRYIPAANREAAYEASSVAEVLDLTTQMLKDR